MKATCKRFERFKPAIEFTDKMINSESDLVTSVASFDEDYVYTCKGDCVFSVKFDSSNDIVAFSGKRLSSHPPSSDYPQPEK